MKNRKNYTKRGLAVLLSLSLCLGTMSLTAFAVEENPPETTPVTTPAEPLTPAEGELPKEAPALEETPTEVTNPETGDPLEGEYKDVYTEADGAVSDADQAIEDANGQIKDLEDAANGTEEPENPDVPETPENPDDEKLLENPSVSEIQGEADAKAEEVTEQYTEAKKEIGAQAELADKAQQAAEEAKKVAQDDTADLADRQQAVQDAQAAVRDAQDAVNAIDEQLEVIQGAVDAAQDALDKAQKDYDALVAEVEGKLGEIGDKDQVLAEAKARLDAAEQKLTETEVARNDLETARQGAWDATVTAQKAAAEALGSYNTAFENAKGAQTTVDTIKGEHETLDKVEKDDLKTSTDDALEASRLKDAADAAVEQQKTVAGLEAAQETIQGINTDKTALKDLEDAVSDKQSAAQTALSNRPKDDGIGIAAGETAVHNWLYDQYCTDYILPIPELSTPTHLVYATNAHMAQWLMEDESAENYEAHQKWLKSEEGQKCVAKFKDNLKNPSYGAGAILDQNKTAANAYVNGLNTAIDNLETARGALDSKTTELTTKYGTAIGSSTDLDSKITETLGTVGAASTEDLNTKTQTAQSKLGELVDAYNQLAGEGNQVTEATEGNLKAAQSAAAAALAEQLKTLDTTVNGKESGVYKDKTTVQLEEAFNKLLSDKANLDGALGKLKALTEAVENLTEKRNQLAEKAEEYQSALDNSQKAHSDYLAAQAKVDEAKKALEDAKLDGLTLNDLELKALADAYEAAQRELEAAEAIKAEADKDLEQAQKDAEDAAEAVRQAEEDIRGQLPPVVVPGGGEEDDDPTPEGPEIFDFDDDDDDDGEDDDLATIIDDQVPLAGLMTRAEFVNYLWVHEGSPEVDFEISFADVAEDNEYRPAIAWACSQGLVEGYTDGNFGPDDVVTVFAIRTILGRYAALNDMAMPELAKLEGEDGDVVMNCEEVVAEFFGEEI